MQLVAKYNTIDARKIVKCEIQFERGILHCD